MVWLGWLLVTAVVVLGAWAVLTAQRLDRLHIRLDRSRDALQAALDRRCAVIAVLHGHLGPAARAVEAVPLQATDLDTRLRAEADLRSRVPGGAEAARDRTAPQPRSDSEMRDADTRVMLALRFYNEAVSDTRALRLHPLVRVMRLGGTAALPVAVHVPGVV